jgi:hypothetical protein
VLTPEEEKYYETYFDVFLHDGWKQFVEEIQEILDGYRIEDIRDEKQLAYVKGERSALLRVVNFADAMKNSYNYNLERNSAA